MPLEAAELRSLEAAMRRVFSSYGYGEVMTPTLEMEASLEPAGEGKLGRSFRLFDEHGDVLVMRPEMTVPIARLVATRMSERQLPLRLCYFANSFRPTRPQRGRQAEFSQAGLELIGIDSAAADAEVLAMMSQVIAACGLQDYTIGLGEASFFRALLDSAGVTGADRDAVFAALMDKNLVQLSRVVGGLDISDDDRQAIMEISTLRGGSDVLTRAQDLVRGPAMDAALKRLARTYYLVSRYGFADRILFDLGIIRDFAYYTGVVFEVLSSGIGFPLGGGGRYNNLLARYGRPAPAVGFALGLDRLHIVASRQGDVAVERTPAVVLAGGLDDAMELAGELRSAGVSVYSIPGDWDLQTARRIAIENDIGFVALVSGGGVQLLDVESDEARNLEGEGLVAALMT